MIIKEYIWTKKRTHTPNLCDFYDSNKTFLNDYTMRQRIRNERRKNKRKGLLIADIITNPESENTFSNVVSIGFSLYKKNKEYSYNDEIAHTIAENRLNKYFKRTGSTVQRKYSGLVCIPSSIIKQLLNFIQRCEKYYKVDGINVVFAPWIIHFLSTTINYKTMDEIQDVSNFDFRDDPEYKM